MIRRLRSRAPESQTISQAGWEIAWDSLFKDVIGAALVADLQNNPFVG
jgi:hypothetical protein